MNTKIEMLKAAAENLNEKRVAAHEVIRDSVLAVMKRVVAESGVPTAYIDEERFDIERPEIRVERDGKRGWEGRSLDVYFLRDWFKKDKTRKLEINVSACGSFDKDSEDLVAYYSLVGYMSRNLAEIEAELNALDWESYDTACRLCDTAMGELEKAEREEKAAADAKLAAEFEAKLVAGAKVKVGTERNPRYVKGSWQKDENGNWLYDEVDVIEEVVKVTAKMVYWNGEHFHGQDKKAEFIAKLVKGEYALVG